MQSNSAMAAIILAAGSSSRMGLGRHKLLLPLGERPVLSHVIAATLASQAFPIVLVLGHEAQQVCKSIAHDLSSPAFIIVENAEYLQGMSTSLRAGLRPLMKRDAITEEIRYFVDSALVLLGDQPLITPHIIDALFATRRTTRKLIIAPLYNGKRGNPVLFANTLFPELLEVTGDEGGRSVLERHTQDIATVEVGDATTSYDVDTWEAYQQVLALWQHTHE